MSFLEETHAADEAGPSTQGGVQPPVGDASQPPMLTLPHLGYGDAIHAEFAAWELHPEMLQAGVITLVPSGRRELFVRLVWPPGHDDLHPDVQKNGLTLAWSHLTGWSAHTATAELLLDVDELAAPAVVAEYALHLAEHGLDHDWVPAGTAGRWGRADELRAVLVAFDERERGVKR